MKVLLALIASLVATATCNLLPTYSLPSPPSPNGGGGGGGGGYGNGQNGQSCGPEQVLHSDGRCVTPEVTRHIYVYNVPQIPTPPGPTPQIPLPKVEHNIVFVRLPEEQGELEPIVVPPPQQKNIIYVLDKKTPSNGPIVIDVPAPPKSNPEVYFVNYGNGENPTLPTGEDLQSALANSAHEQTAQVVGGGGSSGHGGNDGGSVTAPPLIYGTP
ncbi:uncharacterized protein [Palaemon carinicauda]|uniref:uncharacterized protein n=1 Tax=Palaemon carinicauda TaxID=392227 RepID=UPI0035B67E23